MKGWGALIWCSCAAWWLGGDDDIAEHMRMHPRHVWWSAHAYPDELPIGPPWPTEVPDTLGKGSTKPEGAGRVVTRHHRGNATASPRKRTR